MYYLCKTDDGIQVSSPTTASHQDMKNIGFEVVGNFERLDYANHWADFKNGKISEDNHRIWLELNPYKKEDE